MKTRTVDELVAAAGDAAVREIVVHGEVTGVPPLALAAGQRLTGAGEGATLVFAPGADGVTLSRDNEVSGLRLRVDPERRAIRTELSIVDLGTIRLAGLTVVGQVQIMTRARAGHVAVDGLDIVAAEVRDRTERPELLGVGVLQGAFTLWNQASDGTITAELRGIAAGRDGAPVRGSGVFVSGAGTFVAGGLEVGVLETGPVFTDGGIAEGTSDTISGGVFVVYGAHVREVVNHGPVTTYGVNDMILDNWGTVDSWTAERPLTSYGRSGVGFVNFGSVTALRVAAPIETYGVGARGFNVYPLDTDGDPSVGTAEFDRITTHGDAAIGIQIGQPIGRLVVHNGVETHGGSGDSLVRGAIVRLSAHALSVQVGGHVDHVEIDGALRSTDPGVSTVDIRGTVGALHVGGGIR